MSRAGHLETAKTRLVSVIATHGIALARTLEQKIAVAGPYGQRVNPHLITEARNELVEKGILSTREVHGVTWYHMPDTPEHEIRQRLAEQEPTYLQVVDEKFTKRMGQTLEIAVQRALEQTAELDYFGRFTDLNEHDDSALYKKEEPPSHIGGRHLAGKQKLDFLVRGNAFWAGIEVKNTRPWVYPNQDELLELLRKCIALDIVPVLIARRIPYVTGHLFRRCGLITWETLRQRYPTADAELSERARHKRVLGFADISLGNAPDAPLIKFISKNLPTVIPEARVRFDQYKDLMGPFAFGEMGYHEFAARVRRRSAGQDEDYDIPIEEWLEPPW
ncbi:MULTISPECIES: hypothetical protein [unclassified Mesorhizobium]|uniref:hypothetical protein n=1 Tax=unclassified Mesorhizobium TaxID=325217 RepID=UPI001092EAB0|nr:MULTISPECIES: hypothetical protein [unclassified Mesorhizobium]TGQ27721.1 hypothetical protein EN857_32485 [Mesorhizobium sp. M4B.F.Ca.ET.214.01.1.1]TGQ54913.1 hypothetical protein EN854_32370 [Mesorhizobium sp. M4B.F.Ca.ET.211.01.1.1]TGU28312.1 hypothetical protein EN793_32330 [Mesorhizobium sp. M4B.F.Ca.ET.150.01.1.1]